MITDVQKARAIITTVGKPHQGKVSDKLRSLTFDLERQQDDKDAQKVIGNMEKEYVLNTANQLWADHYEDIPDYIKRK